MDLGFAICRGKALQPAKPDWARHCGGSLLADLPRDQSNGSVERRFYSEFAAWGQQHAFEAALSVHLHRFEPEGGIRLG